VKWFLRACPVCGGDLHEDIEDRDWVACFMCGRTFALAELHPRQGRDGAPVTAEPVDLPEAA
jgi:hypothetical protein